ncbi:hypothetical protein C4K09_4068 [Pseudomonas chlororaphis subsp. aureofaciens]|nr:hypothetical protein C4K09_4068 [Pseudomonas chlororaphis subsp. aureofaciens]
MSGHHESAEFFMKAPVRFLVWCSSFFKGPTFTRTDQRSLFHEKL